MLSDTSQGETLENLWNSPDCRTKRIVVAWNGRNPAVGMWPGVNQRWYEHADSLETLYDCKSDMEKPPAGMWATCSFMKSGGVSLIKSTPFIHVALPMRNALNTNPTITNWFFGGSGFCEKANIIYVDFFHEYSNVVQASIIGSLLKAAQKRLPKIDDEL